MKFRDVVWQAQRAVTRVLPGSPQALVELAQYRHERNECHFMADANAYVSVHPETA